MVAIRLAQAKYREKNKEKLRAYSKAYRETHRAEANSSQKKYREKNPEKMREIYENRDKAARKVVAANYYQRNKNKWEKKGVLIKGHIKALEDTECEKQKNIDLFDK